MKIRTALGQLSGSIGGWTASHNKGGQYFRMRSTPTNPDTAAQQAARINFGLSSAAWSALTPAQRQAWNDAAGEQPWTDAQGESITLSGQQWFIGVNSAARTTGLTPVNVPPTPGERPVVPEPTDITAVLTAGDISITVSFAANLGPASSRAALFAGRPTSGGTVFYKAPFRLVAAGSAATTDFSADEEASPLQVGDRIFIRLIVQHLGGQYSTGRILGPIDVTAAP